MRERGMKVLTNKRPAKTLNIDRRGLATFEQKEGAVVEMTRGTYRVEKIDGRRAILKRIDKEKPDAVPG